MPIPTQITIYGIPYRVEEVDFQNEGAEKNRFGHFWAEKGLIKINKNLSPEEKEQTLLHEIIHCFAFYHGIELNEAQVESLATSLLCFFKMNDWRVSR